MFYLSSYIQLYIRVERKIRIISFFYWYYNNDVSFDYIWKINNKSLKQITKYWCVLPKDFVGIQIVCIVTIDNQLYSLLKERIQFFLSSNISSPLIFQFNLSWKQVVLTVRSRPYSKSVQSRYENWIINNSYSSISIVYLQSELLFFECQTNEIHL
jgi:hypothetical protein